MISCDKGQITIEGCKSSIMAEFTSLIHALIEDDGEQVLTEEELDMCIDTAKMSEEELENDIKSMAGKVSPEQLLRALIGTLADLKDM